MRTVTLLGRPGCHLCEEARAELEALRAETPFTLVEVDIEQDDALHARYLERIPVVVVGGEELCDHFVDARAVREALGKVNP